MKVGRKRLLNQEARLDVLLFKFLSMNKSEHYRNLQNGVLLTTLIHIVFLHILCSYSLSFKLGCCMVAYTGIPKISNSHIFLNMFYV